MSRINSIIRFFENIRNESIAKWQLLSIRSHGTTALSRKCKFYELHNSDTIRKRRFPDGRLRISSQSCFVNLSTDPGPILDSVPSNDPNSTGNKGILTVVTKSLLICRLPNSCRYCYSHGPAQHSENNFRDPSSEPIS